MTGLFKKDKNQFLKSSAFSHQNPYCVTHTSDSGDIGEKPAHRQEKQNLAQLCII